MNEINYLIENLTIDRENLEQCLVLNRKIYTQLNEFNKKYQFYQQWIDNIHRTIETISEEPTTIDEKLQRIHDLQTDLDKRKRIINNIVNEYPQIEQSITLSIQNLIGNIERIKSNLNRKHEVWID